MTALGNDGVLFRLDEAGDWNTEAVQPLKGRRAICSDDMGHDFSNGPPKKFGEQPRSKDDRKEPDRTIEKPLRELGETIAPLRDVVHPRTDGPTVWARGVHTRR